MTETITWDDFEAVELRVGTIVSAEWFRQAKVPAYKLVVDFGPEIGSKKSSARITDLYPDPARLVGRQVIGVTNFPPKQIGPFRSEVLVTGFHRSDGVVLAGPDLPVPNGTRLL